MYQFMHEILWEMDNQNNLLINFLKFFSSEQYEINLKYKIKNISYTPFQLHSDQHLEIDFEKQNEYFITIKLKNKIWKNNSNCHSILYNSRIIE